MESVQPESGGTVPTFRLDVQLHSQLMEPRSRTPVPTAADGRPHTLPEPAFPRHPKLLDDAGVDFEALERAAVEGRRKWTRAQILNALRAWAVP
jgi:hypothetical protein